MKIRYKEISIKEAQSIMLDMLINFHKICKENDLSYFLDWGTLLGAVRHKGFIPWDDDLDVSMPREDFERFKIIAKEKLDNQYFLQTPETDKYYKYYYIPMKIRHIGSRYIEKVENGEEKFNHGIYIDIFPLDFLPKGKINYKVQCLYKYIMERSNIVNEGFFKTSSKRKLIYPLVYFFIKVLSISDRKKMEKFFINKTKRYDDRYWSGIDLYLKQEYKKEDLFPLKDIVFENNTFNGPNNADSILKSMYGDYNILPPENERFSHSKKIEIISND